MLASIVGHGGGEDGAKQHPGILEGGDVVWISQDYPNLMTVMWREEFVPRFAHLPWVTMNQNTPGPLVSVHGQGTLYLRSAEAIDGVRGIGKRLRGVIVDEAAHLDLEQALKDVILPALLDNNGWLILMSTTNAGADGNQAKRLPSYFNLICEEIRAGKRGSEWVEFTGTAFDNPMIDDAAIHELIGEYAPDSPALKQEVFAELLTAGQGLALPEISAETHMVEPFEVPSHWTNFSAFDWGYNHPYAFGWFSADDDGNVYLRDTIYGREETPDQIAVRVKAVLPPHALRPVHAGHDCWADHKARGENVPTIAEQMAKHGIFLVKANISRVSGLNNLRAYTTTQTATGGKRIPRFRLFNTEGNRRVLATLQQMQIDAKHIEDAAKMDADSAGRGGDEGYDLVRYGLASRPIMAHAPEDVFHNVKQDDRARPYSYEDRRFTNTPIEAIVEKALRRGQPSSGVSTPRGWTPSTRGKR